MNKKKLVIISVVLGVFIIGGILGYFIHKDHVLKEEIRIKEEARLKEEERIKEINKKKENMTKKLEYFKMGVENPTPQDDLDKYLNGLVKANNEIMQLEYKKLNINDLSKLDKVKSNLLSTLDIDVSWWDVNLSDVIDKYSKEEKEVIKGIYDNSEVISSKDSNIKKYSEYKEKVNRDIEFIKFLESNKDNYYIQNNKVIYKSDEFKNGFDKYNTGISLAKEEVLTGEIILLMYHGVLDVPWGDSGLFVRVNEFREQMKYLKDNGYTPIFLSDIGSASSVENPVLITFDDGYMDVYTNAYPILKEYNFKSNFYIITGWVGGEVYVTSDIIKEMDASGLVEIGSHTVGHVNLAKQSDEDLDRELRESKRYLEDLLGKKINTIAYPYGGYSTRVVNSAKKYYDYAVTTVSGKEYSSKLSNKLTLKRFNVRRGMGMKNFEAFFK